MLRRLSLLFILFCFASFLSLLKKYSDTALTEAPVSIKAYVKILSIFTGTWKSLYCVFKLFDFCVVFTVSARSVAHCDNLGCNDCCSDPFPDWTVCHTYCCCDHIFRCYELDNCFAALHSVSNFVPIALNFAFRLARIFDFRDGLVYFVVVVRPDQHSLLICPFLPQL
jgi:hypothetical protein